MGKASVIIYVTVAMLLLLLLISKNTTNKSHNHNHHRRHGHRRLKLRSNFTFMPPATPLDPHDHHHTAPFDPLVAEIERRREDKQWEHHYFESHHPGLTQGQDGAAAELKQPEWEDFIDAEDYLNDEEKFNVTNRLVLLFPNIDVEPADGYVSQHELTRWISLQNQNENLHRTEREMEIHDKNKDALVSFSEYEPPSWIKQSDNSSSGNHIGWYNEDHFNASDTNRDGLLNTTEFNDFLHPADSTNPKLSLWLCQEEIRERDSDKDGKVNFVEFFHGLFDLVRNYDEGHNYSHHTDDSREAPARQLFGQLDKDGDGYLSTVELLPIIGKVHPSERYYAKQQAEYIIQQADSDKDGRLTLTEMTENPYLFYSAVFNEDEDDDYEYHDEFR